MPRKRINAKTKIEDPWKALSGAMTDTLLAKETTFNTTMIQQACYDLVNKKQFDTLHDGLLEILTNHFREWHDQLRNVAGDPLLTKLSDQYENFQYISSLIPTFYSSYNQHYNQENKTLNIIRKLFIQEVLSDEQLFKKATTPSILEVIHNAQKGSEVDLNKAKNIIQMYYSFCGKNDKPEIFFDFFDRFREQENNFCGTFYNNNFATSSFTTYLVNAQKQFNIINHILNEKQLLRKPEANEILTNFNISLFHSREDDFLKGETPPISTALTADDLRPMKYLVDTYKQFNFDIKPLYKSCAHYIRNEMLKKAQDFPQADEEGKEKDKEKDKDKDKEKGKKGNKESIILTLVGSLIELTLRLIEPYKKVFVNEDENNKAFEKLNKNIVKAWNDNRFNISVNFNDYIDALVKSKFKGYDSNNMAEKLKTEIIPQFYQYVTDKAKFNLYYEASFVRRLIQMRSTIEEYDYPIINCIQKFNHEFMKKLDDFKKALVDSDQLREDFKAAYPESDKNVQIEPFVFDYNVYPLPKDRFDCVPSLAVESNNQFQAFYHSKHQKKSLDLIYQGSLAEFSIKIPLRKKTFTFIMDLPCACVISALSSRPHKFAEIIEILGNNKQLANKVILKLYQKTKLIVPKEKIVNRKLSNDDIFIMNPSYYSDKTRVFITPVIQGQWRDHLPNVYETEKKEAIKCAIVRVLKQKQKMENDEMERVIIGRLQSKYDINADQIRREAVLLENKFIKSEVKDGQKIITYIG